MKSLIRLLCSFAIIAGLAALVIAVSDISSAASDFVGSAAIATDRLFSPLDQWIVMNSPNVGSGNNVLNSIVGYSATDLAAVGYYEDASLHQHTLVQHYDGTSWSVVASVDPNANTNRLYSVTTNKAGGYWAAGVSFDPTHNALIEQQATAGGAWTLSSIPSISGFPLLYSISADSPTDAWAVGYRSFSPYQTLVLHWNGTAWSIVSSPNPGAYDNVLTGVVAADANNIWAVGRSTASAGGSFSPIAIRCNSALTCTSVSFPSPGAGSTQLTGITALAANDLYVSGIRTNAGVDHPVVAHGDGTSFSIVTVPDPNPAGSSLGAIWGPAGANNLVVAAGTTLSGTRQVPFALRKPTGTSTWEVSSPVTIGNNSNFIFGVGGYGGLGDAGAPAGPTGAAPYIAGAWDMLMGLDQTLIEENLPGPPPPTATICEESITPGPSPTAQLSGIYDRDLWYIYGVENNGEAQPISDITVSRMLKELLTSSNISQWRDAKIMFQECFGGGMLNQVKTALDPTDLKWVGGSASTAYQPSAGQVTFAEATQVAALGQELPDWVVSGQPEDFWTISLQSELAQDQTLAHALSDAARYDYFGNQETGQFITVNGGESIRLRDQCAVSHHAVLWGGYANKMRHFYDIQRIRDTLISAWGPPNGTTVTIDVLFGNGILRPDGGPLPADWNAQRANVDNLQATFDHLRTLANTSEQFLFYVSDHGGLVKSVLSTGGVRAANPQQTVTPVPLPPGGQQQATFNLTRDEIDALLWDVYSMPSIAISYTGSLDSNTAVSVSLNGSQVGYLQQGALGVTLPFSKTLLTDTNQLLLQSSNSTTIYITNEAMDTGPVADEPPVCTTAYTDVLPGSTFYSYVECIACAGMISGYTDGTFRPNNHVTRGQLSKIVANAAKYEEAYTTATFNDVPVGSTFFLYVQRLASRGIISGYPCGGPGEPCVPPGNLPYFRPNNNVTRGQTSKIVAIANGLPAPPVGQQSFEDVPVGSTFWQWIEALSSVGSISGYPCGGAGEPCVPPGNRSYFRPGNNVTRGQASKIVSRTFFPNCQAP